MPISIVAHLCTMNTNKISLHSSLNLDQFVLYSPFIFHKIELPSLGINTDSL